jgi:steroid delta-isomerase-like uncharacterized protein
VCQWEIKLLSIIERGPTVSEQNKTVVRRIVEEHWNKKNAALVSELFAPNVSLRTPDGQLTGLDGASALLQAYATAFPDFRIIIDELLAMGDQVVLQWTFTGTHLGPLADIPATGRQVNTTPGIAIFRIEAGKVIKGQFVWDKYELLQQLGVLASRAAGAQAAPPANRQMEPAG